MTEQGPERGQGPQPLQALRVRQWLEAWDDLKYDPSQSQAKPKEHFYLLSMPASQLRALTGIYRRSTDAGVPRAEDLGIQRRHDPERSDEIRRYVEGGYPWSALTEVKRRNKENDKLKKPGWLPTAVVVNILAPGDLREGHTMRETEVLEVIDDPQMPFAEVRLPKSSERMSPAPIEVIDGQHRLFAFDGEDGSSLSDYHLPVVAFHGLDISWQAYLFWTINIKPKKINPSLAFDLYPLLREQDWLDSGEAVQVYRESRAQELTEVLWSTPNNPWYRRINMLGGSRAENGPVTQAAFIRSLIASMVKSWRPSWRGPGGIFGGTPDQDEGLSWSRVQQGAFLLTAWRALAEQVQLSNSTWALALREQAGELEVPLGDSLHRDAAFTGPHTLLATDQGVRGFQHVVNDLCYVMHRDLGLSEWVDKSQMNEVSPTSIDEIARTLRDLPVQMFLNEIADGLSSFDWRSSNAPGLGERERIAKAAFRGSGGYKELRAQLTRHLGGHGSHLVQQAVRRLGEKS